MFGRKVGELREDFVDDADVGGKGIGMSVMS